MFSSSTDWVQTCWIQEGESLSPWLIFFCITVIGLSVSAKIALYLHLVNLSLMSGWISWNYRTGGDWRKELVSHRKPYVIETIPVPRFLPRPCDCIALVRLCVCVHSFMWVLAQMCREPSQKRDGVRIQDLVLFGGIKSIVVCSGKWQRRYNSAQHSTVLNWNTDGDNWMPPLPTRPLAFYPHTFLPIHIIPCIAPRTVSMIPRTV